MVIDFSYFEVEASPPSPPPAAAAAAAFFLAIICAISSSSVKGFFFPGGSASLGGALALAGAFDVTAAEAVLALAFATSFSWAESSGVMSGEPVAPAFHDTAPSPSAGEPTFATFAFAPAAGRKLNQSAGNGGKKSSSSFSFLLTPTIGYGTPDEVHALARPPSGFSVFAPGSSLSGETLPSTATAAAALAGLQLSLSLRKPSYWYDPSSINSWKPSDAAFGSVGCVWCQLGALISSFRPSCSRPPRFNIFGDGGENPE